MLSKLFSVGVTLAGFAAAEDVITRPSINLSALSLTADGSFIAWEPSLDGLRRNQFRLPERGILDAVKYGDASALYYLSDIRDGGLRLGHQRGKSLQFQLGSDASSIGYEIPISATTDFTLVGEFGKEARLHADVSYKFLGSDLNLNVITASVLDNTITARIEGVQLTPSEQAENFWGADTQSDGRYAIGRRWFGIAHNFDTALALGYADARPYLQGAVELENSLGRSFLGIRAGERGRAEIQFGIRMKFEQSGRAFNTSPYDIHAPSGTLTLKFISDSQRPSFWRRAVTF